jgi:hypothetical protein
MCGVVGIATSCQSGFRQDEVSAFNDLIFLDTMRGYDSTGVMGMDKHGNVVVHKEASMGPMFIKTNTFDGFKKDMFQHGIFAAAHNRAATRGSITDKNAHPFIVDDNIVLMQNGTYKGDHKKHKDTEVDTEAVAHVISEHEDVQEALKKINASYAFVWFNSDKKQVNLIRNSERPLWILKTEQGSLVWASESAFLYMALNRNGIKFTEKAVEVPVHTLITLTINGTSWKREDTKLQCEYTFPVHYGTAARHSLEDDLNDINMWDINQGMARHTYPVQSRGPWVKPYDVHNVKTLPDNDKCLQVERGFADVICDKKFNEYHVERALGFKTAEAVSALNWTKEHCIEIIDYLPGNSLPGCRVWHVFGHFVYEDASANAVVHFLVNNKSEAEIMNMVSETWFMGKITTQRLVNVDSDTAVPTVFGHSLLEIQTESVVTQ